MRHSIVPKWKGGPVSRAAHQPITHETEDKQLGQLATLRVKEQFGAKLKMTPGKPRGRKLSVGSASFRNT